MAKEKPRPGKQPTKPANPPKGPKYPPAPDVAPNTTRPDRVRTA